MRRLPTLIGLAIEAHVALGAIRQISNAAMRDVGQRVPLGEQYGEKVHERMIAWLVQAFKPQKAAAL